MARERRMVERLAAFDQMFLRLETDDWPCHFGGLVVVDGATLLDTDGQLRTDALLEWLGPRTERVRRLRQRVESAGVLGGRPIWADDAGFDVRRHVRTARVEPPGGEAELLDAAVRAYGELLDRGRPLWEIWLLTGLARGRVGVLLKLHHAVADGMAAVTVMSALFDDDAAGRTDDRPGTTTGASSAPSSRDLLADRAGRLLASAGAAGLALAHPVALVRRVRRLARTTRNFMSNDAAPASSLNRPVRAGRRVGHLELDLSGVKVAAHDRAGTVNDVVLALWAGGIRELLTRRGEPTAGVELRAAVPVSLRSGQNAEIDNRTGTIVLPLPIGEADAGRRLARIAETTRRTKATQRPAAVAGFLARLAATSGGRSYVLHQRANNVVVTNIKGPPRPSSFAEPESRRFSRSSSSWGTSV